MKTDTKLPEGVAEALYLMTCGGEVYDSRVILGKDVLRTLLGILYGKPEDADPAVEVTLAEHLADSDNWYEVDGKCVHFCHDEEDGQIEFHLIAEPSHLATMLAQFDTFKQGLHQAKFEYQCLRADLGNEQKKYDQLRTAVDMVMADMGGFIPKDCKCQRCVTHRAWIGILQKGLMPPVDSQKLTTETQSSQRDNSELRVLRASVVPTDPAA